MTGKEYQSLAMRTADEQARNLNVVGLGITGEAGEVSDLIKKHLYHGHDMDYYELVKELGDVMWYVALGCEVAGVDMDYVMQVNIQKLKERYPEGFSSERSINREN